MAQSGEAENIVIVQPSPYGTDNSLILDKLVELQAEKTRREVRAIAVINPDNITDSELDHMQALGVRGIRVNTEATGEEVGYDKLRSQIENAVMKIRRFENWRCQLFVSGDNWPRESLEEYDFEKVCITKSRKQISLKLSAIYRSRSLLTTKAE